MIILKFTNNHYKKAELILYKYLILKTAQEKGYECSTFDETQMLEEIEKCFHDSESINKEVLGCLFVKRNYYDAIGMKNEALKVDDIIKEKSNYNAAEWLKKIAKFSLLPPKSQTESIRNKIAKVVDISSPLEYYGDRQEITTFFAILIGDAVV